MESTKPTMYQIEKSTATVRFEDPSKVEYKCMLCMKNFLTKVDVNQHLVNLHGGKQIRDHITNRGVPLVMTPRQCF